MGWRCFGERTTVSDALQRDLTIAAKPRVCYVVDDLERGGLAAKRKYLRCLCLPRRGVVVDLAQQHVRSGLPKGGVGERLGDRVEARELNGPGGGVLEQGG